MKILVTGAAGFIGAAMVKALLADGHEVVGLDNINSYYDTSLKYARLAESGVRQALIHDNVLVESHLHAAYRFVKMELNDRIQMDLLFSHERFDAVIHLAGQAGVRYSIDNPFAYVESNVMGFLCILENCRHHPVKQLIYASSSSVYGMKESTPLAETDFTDAPVSLYAATKKSDELMAYSYSRLYHISATGVRFFTVYGPWGRPDMAPFLFLQSIMEGRKLRVFNYGLMQRDFTYIDDIVKGVMCIVGHPSTAAVPHAVYNIGHSSPVQLLDFIHTIEATTGKKAIMEKTGMQPGDVVCTYADTSRLRHDFGYSPQVSIDEGIKRFYDWYVDFYPSRARA